MRGGLRIAFGSDALSLDTPQSLARQQANRQASLAMAQRVRQQIAANLARDAAVAKARFAFQERTSTLILHGLILAQLFLTIFFNLSSDGLRLVYSGVVLALSVPFAWSGYQQASPLFRNLIGLYAISLAVSWMGAFFVGGHDSELASMVKEISVLVWTTALITQAHRTNLHFLKWACVSVLAYALVMIATHPFEPVGGILRPYPFSGGGANGPHSSAYLVFAFLVITIQLWRTGTVSRTLGLLLGGGFLALLIAYQVRTTWTMSLVAFVLWLSRDFAKFKGGGRVVSIAILAGVVLLIVGVVASGVDLNQISSGRLDNYQDRLSRITDRGPAEIFFGTGAGSDVFRSSVWWWEAKNSHNDLLQATIERGFIGLVGLLCFFASLIVSGRGRAMPAAAAWIAASAISNGLMGRPNPAFWTGVALCLCAAPSATTLFAQKRREAPSLADLRLRTRAA